MVICFRLRRGLVLLLLALLAVGGGGLALWVRGFAAQAQGDYIKWVEFTPSYSAMAKALEMDIAAHKDGGYGANFAELLAYLGTKYGGNFSRYRSSDLTAVQKRLAGGETMDEIMAGNKYYGYYKEAYGAVVGNFVGEYIRQRPDPQDDTKMLTETGYGLKVFSPIARNYGYSHFDDFGNSRSYGFRRKHLGNDLVTSVGTPVVAVEGGIVEAAGWNQYGGWRIGIRSFDGKRYYYYAHLRKGHPFNAEIKEGATVEAGEVIGYVGMTGYSNTENVNGMTVPHLHFGMQLIFDESQKEGNNEIWIDVYQIVRLLEKSRSSVVKNEETKEYHRKYPFLPVD
ncbi:MAG: M23 family metallopeptidase [Angelakisella sp.]|nr:M23 family metallopeptidase [Angelakisella sp.]